MAIFQGWSPRDRRRTSQGSCRRLCIVNNFLVSALFVFLGVGSALPAMCQDDVTTQNAASGPDGAFITGPASNPLSFLNGPAYRTSGPPSSYDLGNFHPV